MPIEKQILLNETPPQPGTYPHAMQRHPVVPTSSFLAVFVVALMVLAACTTPPPPREPALGYDPPSAWQADSEPGPVQNAWWQQLGDPALATCIDQALQHNQDLIAAAARVEAALAQAQIAGAELYPLLNANLHGNRARQNFIGFPIPGSTGVLSRTFNSYGVSLNLSWELDLWGRVRAGHSAALADVESTNAEFHAARLSLVAQTAKAWFAVVESHEQLRLAADTVQSFQTTAAQVQQRFQAGVRPALDLRLALANVAGAQAQSEQRRQQLARAIRQLELLMGRYPSGATVTTATLPTELPTVPAGVPAEALRRRPDLHAAERRLVAADARLDRARASLYPRLSLTASGGTASDDLSDLLDTDFRVWSLAGNLLQPLFEGGRLRADVTRNEALVIEAAAQFAAAAQRAFTEVEIALAAETILIEHEQHLQAHARHTRAARQLAEDRYLRGLIDFLNVADAQRSALAAESQWLTIRRQRLEVRIDLHLALGGGFQPTDAPAASPQP
jgi:NodT family efflux transporter outer membrane factor (OMF) lipoprotein